MEASHYVICHYSVLDSFLVIFCYFTKLLGSKVRRGFRTNGIELYITSLREIYSNRNRSPQVDWVFNFISTAQNVWDVHVCSSILVAFSVDLPVKRGMRNSVSAESATTPLNVLKLFSIHHVQKSLRFQMRLAPNKNNYANTSNICNEWDNVRKSNGNLRVIATRGCAHTLNVS